MSSAYNFKDPQSNPIDSVVKSNDNSAFSDSVNKLIEEKFNFSCADIVLERKPKADKGV